LAEHRRPGIARTFRRAAAASSASQPIPSPNIWHWPEVYERENAAQDADGLVWAALRELVPWAGGDVLDVGCGAGFHLPVFAAEAASVVGVEPFAPLVERARRRVGDTARVVEAGAAALPLPDASVDLVHARTAYFFGPGCEPGLAEAERVLRPGGAIAIVDLDATAAPYGDWMRADLPRYDPAAVERFFTRAGFSTRRVPTVWRFPDRATLEAVLRIEFSAAVAERAVRLTTGLTVPVGYRLHVRRKHLLGAHARSASFGGR
jgi:SAM-dependent methyltransferase